jgi:hypothetical protein
MFNVYSKFDLGLPRTEGSFDVTVSFAGNSMARGTLTGLLDGRAPASKTGVASLCCGATRFPKFNSGVMAPASALARLHTIY